MSVRLQEQFYNSCYKHNFHIFRKGKHLRMQDNFLFFDTETVEYQKEIGVKELNFKMGTCIEWNRKNDVNEKFVFYNVNFFWDKVEGYFSKERKQFIMFAHNAHFDFKMCDGFNQLSKRGWTLVNHYVRNKVYILLFKKGNYILHIWDTGNYVPHALYKIGETIGYPKLEIDFEKCSKLELEVYCMRDTEILFMFVKSLVNFLVENNLSRLKATASSLSFNIFRHKFYDFNDKKIWIHDFKRAIMLERESYRGGITDVFRLGNQKEIYKLDINSQYPYIMKNMKLPTKLIYYSHESDKKLCGKSDEDCYIDLTDEEYNLISDNLMQVYQNFKRDYGIIARCTVFLPKKYAYVLNDFGLGKTSFVWGKMEVCLASPELDFVERHGKIIKIHEINVYEVKQIFKEFVDFFYDLKSKYDTDGNEVYRSFTKLILNGQYGKWGQKEYISERLDFEHNYLIKHQDMILDIIEMKKDIVQKSAFVYLGSINSKELYLIDKKLYLSYNTSNNSKESFVAISSFITSGARMLLIDYLLTSERKNVCYCDTDSLFVNQNGYDNLDILNLINKNELGMLKNEGFAETCQFYNPKFYDFNDERKLKGVPLKADGTILLLENNKMAKYQIELWDKFKSDYKKGNVNNQLIRIAEKVMSKKYDKGIIKSDGFIEPFHVSQIRTLNKTLNS